MAENNILPPTYDNVADDKFTSSYKLQKKHYLDDFGASQLNIVTH